MYDMHFTCDITIRPNLELKSRPKQRLGSLQLDILLPGACAIKHYGLIILRRMARFQNKLVSFLFLSQALA